LDVKKYTQVHDSEIDFSVFAPMYPDGKVAFKDPIPPQPNKLGGGTLRHCEHCGSMHPADVVAAIKAGARGEIADMKYGWPHKVYFHDVPNPHKGLPASRSGASQPQEGYIKAGERNYLAPPQPEPATTWGKFYTIHLQDATDDEREVIENYLNLRFTFKDGGVSWHRIKP
jgi:hypothetical protein